MSVAPKSWEAEVNKREDRGRVRLRPHHSWVDGKDGSSGKGSVGELLCCLLTAPGTCVAIGERARVDYRYALQRRQS